MSDREKIKEEIEKQRQLIWPSNTGEMKIVETPKPIEQGWLNCLKWVEDLIDSLPEESGCEVNFTTKNEDLDYLVISLEETIGTSPHSREVIKEHLQRAAEWQKQQMKETLQTEYEKGRFDMREEMMKDAVECTWGSQATSAFMSDFTNIDIGDKVKIVVLKTE